MFGYVLVFFVSFSIFRLRVSKNKNNDNFECGSRVEIHGPIIWKLAKSQILLRPRLGSLIIDFF